MKRPKPVDLRFLMTRSETPKFLADLCAAAHPRAKLTSSVEEAMHRHLPLHDLLRGSLFYPASGLDGSVLSLYHYFPSFVYADYGVELLQVQEALSSDKWDGFSRPFKLIAMRDVSEELVPSNWEPHPNWRHECGKDLTITLKDRQPFAIWAILGDRPSQATRLISLLFVGAESATTFNRLYIDNAIAPAALAVIQPSDALGSNWTDFRKPGGTFSRLVASNPAGPPKYYVAGGRGSIESYAEPDWPEYSALLAWPLPHLCGTREAGATSIWTRVKGDELQ